MTTLYKKVAGYTLWLMLVAGSSLASGQSDVLTTPGQATPGGGDSAADRDSAGGGDSTGADAGSRDPGPEAPSRPIYETLVFGAPVAMNAGQEFPGLAQSTASLAVTPASEQFETQLQDLEGFQDTISAIEYNGGAWDPGLPENLAAMAELFTQQGAYEEAVAAYERAIHISRVNLGLDSLDHIPAVERLIDNYVALGDWENADRYQEYLYYAQRKAFGLNDPRMVPVLDRLARWKLSVFNARWGDEQGLNLISALRLYRMASSLVSVHYGSQDARYFRYLRDTAGTAYLVSSYRTLVADASQPEYRLMQERYPDQSNTFSPAFIEGYEEGLEALQLIVDSFPEQDRNSIDFANALIHLGDWYLLFDRRRTAESVYGEAYQLLSGLPDGEELVNEILGKVVPLPAFSEEIEAIFVSSMVSGRSSNARENGFVDVQFDITAYGAVTDLEVLASETEIDRQVLSSLRRKVRTTTFRPIIENGEMVRSDGNRFRYQFVY